MLSSLGLGGANAPLHPLWLRYWLNLGLKPHERVTNKRLDLGQAPVGAGLFVKPPTHIHNIQELL